MSDADNNIDSPLTSLITSEASPTTSVAKVTVSNDLDPPKSPSQQHQQQSQLPVETKEELIAAPIIDHSNLFNIDNGSVKSSPLLSSTPPTVSKALIKSYPFLMLSHKVLSILTWTDDNINISLFLVVFSTIGILYYDKLITYAGHLFPVLILWIYSEAYAYVSREENKKASLDDIIQTMSQVAQKTEILISPIVALNLTAGDLKRLLFTTIFLSPAYIVISLFILSPQKMLLILIFSLLTYHSQWSRITRNLLWKSRTIRLICFYMTGLDFENQYTERPSLFHLNKRLKSKLPSFNSTQSNNNSRSFNKTVRFTYVLYENQRKWLAVGWTPNLLSYERTPWSDEFINEAPPLEQFELPKLSDEAGMIWRWVDKTWRLDRTNDSAIQINSGKAKTTANPKYDEGWIYFDNIWKNPGLDDTFSKYTRRRRWVRTAELVKIGTPINNHNDDIKVVDSKVKFGLGNDKGEAKSKGKVKVKVGVDNKCEDGNGGGDNNNTNRAGDSSISFSEGDPESEAGGESEGENGITDGNNDGERTAAADVSSAVSFEAIETDGDEPNNDNGQIRETTVGKRRKSIRFEE